MATATKPRNRGGRPRSSSPRSEMQWLRLTPAEKAWLERQAAAQKLTLSQLLRDIIADHVGEFTDEPCPITRSDVSVKQKLRHATH